MEYMEETKRLEEGGEGKRRKRKEEGLEDRKTDKSWRRKEQVERKMNKNG